MIDKELRKLKRELGKKSQKELVSIILDMEFMLERMHMKLEISSRQSQFNPSHHRSVGGITLPVGM